MTGILDHITLREKSKGKTRSQCIINRTLFYYKIIGILVAIAAVTFLIGYSIALVCAAIIPSIVKWVSSIPQWIYAIAGVILAILLVPLAVAICTCDTIPEEDKRYVCEE